jgi:hypothetical protein
VPGARRPNLHISSCHIIGLLHSPFKTQKAVRCGPRQARGARMERPISVAQSGDGGATEKPGTKRPSQTKPCCNRIARAPPSQRQVLRAMTMLRIKRAVIPANIRSRRGRLPALALPSSSAAGKSGHDRRNRIGREVVQLKPTEQFMSRLDLRWRRDSPLFNPRSGGLPCSVSIRALNRPRRGYVADIRRIGISLVRRRDRAVTSPALLSRSEQRRRIFFQ